MSSIERAREREYTPISADAARLAHARRVRLDRQKRLDDAKAKKAAAEKQQKIIDSYQRVGAQRLAELKAAETKAAKRLPDPSIFKGITGPAAGPAPGSLGAQIQAGLSTTISNIKKVASKRAKPITDAGLKSQEGISGILNYWAAKNDKLYEKGNFMTPAEKTEVLTEVQKNPFLAYDIMTGTKPEKPPKTFDEAVNRLNYMVSEAALGGAREVALPFSVGSGKPRRTEDAILQVVGGLLTPSPADLLVSTAFRTLAKGGKKGTDILRKAMRGTAMTSDEALQFEKLVGQYGYSTNDLRKAGTKLNKLSNAEWDELVKGYENYYDFWKKNPDLYGAGAAYKPSLLQEFGEILDDLDYDAGEYIDFLKTNKLGPTLNPATLAAFASGLKPPIPDLKAYEKIESEIEKYRESQALKKPVISGPVTRTEPKPPEPTEPGYTPKPPGEVLEEEGDLVKPGVTPPPFKQKKKQPVPQEPGYKPPPEEEKEEIIQTVIGELDQTVIEDIDQTVIEEVVETVIEDLDQTIIDDTVIEEVVETVTEDLAQVPPIPGAPETPVPEEAAAPPPRTGKKGGMPRNIFRALVGGKSEEYRVQFDYPRGKTETFTVKARSFPQALGQAQGLRRIRKSPSEVDIMQKEEKK